MWMFFFKFIFNMKVLITNNHKIQTGKSKPGRPMVHMTVSHLLMLPSAYKSSIPHIKFLEGGALGNSNLNKKKLD